MDSVFYPAILKFDETENVYYVILPDFCDDEITYGGSLKEAINSAKDVISLYLYELKEEGKDYPEPTNVNDIRLSQGESIVIIDLWLPYHFSKMKDIYKKKTLTIPTWLDLLAQEKNINFSSVLQKALKKELGINQ